MEIINNEIVVPNIITLVMIVGGWLVIRVKNPVHAVLNLVLVICNAAMLVVGRELEFMGLMLIVVYVGAIIIMFLFVVMMLNVKRTGIEEISIGGLIGIVLLTEIMWIVSKSGTEVFEKSTYVNNMDILYKKTNIEGIGQILYTTESEKIILASMVLLVGMIGAITLTMEKGIRVKKQEKREQQLRQWNKTVYKVN